MCTFERYMKILKGYVRNWNQPESCIIEGYIYEETVEFCNEYLSNVETIGLPKRVCTNKTNGTGNIRLNVVTVSRDLLCQAHKYILYSTDEVQTYINEHLDILNSTNEVQFWRNIGRKKS